MPSGLSPSTTTTSLNRPRSQLSTLRNSAFSSQERPTSPSVCLLKHDIAEHLLLAATVCDLPNATFHETTETEKQTFLTTHGPIESVDDTFSLCQALHSQHVRRSKDAKTTETAPPRTIYYPDLSSSDVISRSIVTRANVQCFYAIVLFGTNGASVAVLSVFGPTAKELQASQITALETVANIVERAIQAHVKFKEQEKSLATLSVLNSIAVAANLCESPEEGIELGLREICNYFNCNVAHYFEIPSETTIGLLDIFYADDVDKYAPLKTATNPTKENPLESLLKRVLTTSELAWMEFETDERYPSCSELGIHQVLGIPVMVKSKIVGMIELFSKNDVVVDEDFRRVILHVATQIGRVLERARVEGDLESQTMFLNAVLDNLSDGIVACDGAGMLSLFNKATARWHGLDQERLAQEDWPKYYHLYRADGVTKLTPDEVPLSLAFRGKLVLEDEIIIAPVKGQPKRVLCSGKALFGKDDKQLGAVVAMRDVTDQRAAEIALKESESKYRALLESAPDSIIGSDFSGNIVTCNDAAGKMFGRSKDQMIGAPFTILLAEKDRAAHKNPLTHQHEVIERTGRTLELCASFFDGSEFPIEMAIAIYPTDNATCVTYIIRDISERKRIEKALEETSAKAEEVRRFSENVVKLAPNYIYIHDIKENESVYSNQSASKFLGFLKDGECMEIGSYSTDQDKASANYTDLCSLKDGEIIELHQKIRSAAGDWRWISKRETIFNRDLDGSPRHIIGVAQDITPLKQTEEELTDAKEKSEQRVEERTAEMALLAENIPHLVWQCDVHGEILYMNCKWNSYTGLSECNEETFLSVIHPSDRGSIMQDWRRGIAIGKPFTGQWRLRSKDGEYRWFGSRAVPYLGPDGVILRWFGTSTDIHDEKEADAMKSRFEIIVEQNPFPTQLFTPRGDLTTSNLAWHRLYAHCGGSLLSSDIHTYNILKDERLQDLGVSEYAARAFKGERVVTPSFLLKPTSLGRTDRWIEWHFSPVKNQDGIIIEVILMLIDITEKKAHEEQQQASRRQLSATFNQAAVGIAHVSPDMRWLKANRRLCLILGYSEEELCQRTLRDVCHADDYLIAEEKFRQLRDGEIEHCVDEHRYVRKNGKIVWVNRTAALVRKPDGESDFFITVFEDIDKRRQAEIELTKLEHLFRNASWGIALTSNDSVILRVNPAFARMHGTDSVDYWVGRRTSDIDSPRCFDLNNEHREELLKNGHSHFETEHVRTDGSTFPVLVDASVCKDERGTWSIVGANIQDMTERKRVEKEREEARVAVDAAEKASQLKVRRAFASFFSPRAFQNPFC